MSDGKIYLHCVGCFFFPPPKLYLHLAVDRWDSISSTEGSHVNHKRPLFSIPWFIISIDICHILMSKSVGPPVNLCSPPGHTSDGETVIKALPDSWISSPSGRNAITAPRARGAAHCEIETWVSHWLGESRATEAGLQAQHVACEIAANGSCGRPLHGIDVFCFFYS